MLWLLLAPLAVARPGDVARWAAVHDEPHIREVNAIAQTADGSLWVGSERGLFRFDGLDWHDDAEIGGAVDDLLLDARGQLWIAAGARLLRQNSAGERSEVVRLPGQNAGIRKLRWIDDSLYLAASNGVLRLDHQHGLQSLPGLEANGAFDLAPGSSAHGLLAGSLRGLLEWRDGSWQQRFGEGGARAITRLEHAADGSLWLGGYRLWRQPAAGNPAAPEPGIERVRRLALLSNGELWVGTHADGLQIRAADGTWRRGDRRLRGETINAIFEDREHDVWVGTIGGGLHRFALSGLGVIEADDGLPSKLLSSVAAGAEGELWVASYGRGGVRIARDGSIAAFTTPCGNALLSLVWEAPDALWIGAEGGLCHWREGVATQILAQHTVFGIAPAQGGGVWVLGTHQLSLVRGDRVEQRIEFPQLRPPAHVFTMLDDGDGGVWLGSDLGLEHFDADDHRLVNGDGPVNALLGADDDALWLLQDARLVLQMRDGRRGSTPVMEQAWMLWRDDEGQLWQIGGLGAARVSERALRERLAAGQPAPDWEIFVATDGHEGVYPSGVGFPQATTLPDGRLAFISHGQVRIGRLAPAGWQRIAPLPQLRNAQAPGVTSAEDGHAFAPDQQPLTLRYGAASLRDPQALRFRHRLQPLETDWSPSTSERMLSIGRLPPGAYTFEVEALLPDTPPAPAAQYHFSILPRWHETLWARSGGALAAVLAVALATAGLLRWRYRRIGERQRELEAVVTARTAELQAANVQLAELARTDALTGLANRREFRTAYEQEWRRARREGWPLGVLMIDVDHFKAYNDRHGHGAGDETLRRIAAALAASLHRPGELVARYGGEEFVALLPRTDLAGAIAVAEAMRTAVVALAIPHAGRKEGDSVSISLGAAALVPSDDAAEALLAQADTALYSAKHGGRNRVESYRASSGPPT